MRHIGSPLCILLLTGSCTLAPVVPQPTRVPTATASASAYLHPLEKEIVREHNLARSQPRRYAGLLTELRKHYKDKIVERPNRPPFSTQEGIEAIDEAITFLHRTRVLVPLYPSHGLSLSARDHVEDQGPKGETGHIGSDLSALRDRVGRYGSWRQIIAENIAYGPTTARDVVMGLIVDDGVADRGHRKAIFNPFLRVIGVHCGYHKVYDVMCVMNYAAGFIDTPSNQIAR